MRYLPLHSGTNGLINDYLDAAGHGADDAGALSRPLRNNATGRLDKAITSDGIYKLVRAYSAQLGFEIGAPLYARRPPPMARSPGRHRQGAGVARTRQHRHYADLRFYDHRRTRPEDSPTFKVAY
jgi:integrase/recombinase XerD